MPKYTILLLLLAGLLLAGCGAVAPAEAVPTAPAGVTAVEIVYLNHGPVRSVLTDLDQLLAGYGEKIYVARYDVDSADGAAFAAAKGITGHTPLAIFVNGAMEATVDGRTVKFFSFPEGQGTFLADDGGWTLADLQQVLDQAVAQN